MKTIYRTTTTYKNIKQVQDSIETTMPNGRIKRSFKENYYVDGKRVSRHERYMAEERLLMSDVNEQETTSEIIKK